MTRALVTQMLEALEHGYMVTGAHAKYTAAITAAREYLATEPSGDRSELVAALKHELAEFAHNKVLETLLLDSVDMLEADAQQAKRVPMTDREISEIVNRYYRLTGPAEFARAIEAHHGITPQ